MSKIEFRDLGWRWQMFGGQQMLVTDGGGAMVVIAPARGSSVMTRDPETGGLRLLVATDEVAKLIAAAPELRRYAQSLVNGIDIGLVTVSSDADDTLLAILSGLRTALAKAGDA